MPLGAARQPGLCTAGRRCALLGTVGHCWVPLGAAGHICANFATCSSEPLTMLNPHFVAGEHGFLGAMSPMTFGLFEHNLENK